MEGSVEYLDKLTNLVLNDCKNIKQIFTTVTSRRCRNWIQNERKQKT